jgi:hypothetical protein
MGDLLEWEAALRPMAETSYSQRRGEAVKLPEVDAVNINELSTEARTAITDALFDDGWDVGKSWIDFDMCCGIWFRLKYAKDDPDLFPKGKWATLQRFEQLIEQAVRSQSDAGVK